MKEKQRFYWSLLCLNQKAPRMTKFDGNDEVWWEWQILMGMRKFDGNDEVWYLLLCTIPMQIKDLHFYCAVPKTFFACPSPIDWWYIVLVADGFDHQHI